VTSWIFLRGLSRERRHWGEFIASFQAEVSGAEVVALDLPGNGSRNQFPSFTRVGDMVGWCRRELAARGFRPPHYLLGMSLGAMVAAEWASVHPEDIRGCVLINASLRPYSRFYQRLRPANYSALFKLAVLGGSDDEWESTILRITSNSKSTAKILPSWIAWRREHPVTRVNALRQLLAAWRYRAPAKPPMPPLLVLASARDALVDVQCSQDIATRWQARYAEHPAAGHDLPLDDGDWVAKQVSAWLGTRKAQSTLAGPAGD